MGGCEGGREGGKGGWEREGREGGWEGGGGRDKLVSLSYLTLNTLLEIVTTSPPYIP